MVWSACLYTVGVIYTVMDFITHMSPAEALFRLGLVGMLCMLIHGLGLECRDGCASAKGLGIINVCGGAGAGPFMVIGGCMIRHAPELLFPLGLIFNRSSIGKDLCLARFLRMIVVHPFGAG